MTHEIKKNGQDDAFLKGHILPFENNKIKQRGIEVDQITISTIRWEVPVLMKADFVEGLT